MTALPDADEAGFVQAQTVLWRRLPDRVVLLSPQEEHVVALTGSGTVLWDLLGEPRTLRQLGAELAAAYGADAQLVAEDVEPLLADLVRRGLVDRS